jgi:hypothetical protein
MHPIAGWKALKQTLRVCLRACFKINESKQTVFKLSSPKSSGTFRQTRRIPLPEPSDVCAANGSDISSRYRSMCVSPAMTALWAFDLGSILTILS